MKASLAWACLILALVGLGAGLHFCLPPEPLWRLDGTIVLVPEQPLFFTWRAAAPEGPWTAVLCDLRTGQPIRTLFADCKGQGWLSFSPNGRWVTCVDQQAGTLRIASLADATERVISFGNGDSIRSHQVSPDGALAAVDLSFRQDGVDATRAVLIDIDSGKQVAESPGLIYGDAAFTPDGSLFVANLVDGDSSVLKAWDTRKRAWVLELESSKIPKRMDHAVSPDGRTLVDKFRAEANEPGWAVWDLRDFTRAIVGPTGSKLHQWAFSADGRRLALVHGKRREQWHVDVWDVDARRYLLRLHCECRADVVLSPDGMRLAMQTYEGSEDTVKCLALIDLDTGRHLWEKRDWQHMFWPEPLPMFGPGGRTIVHYPGMRQPLCAEVLDAEIGAVLASLPLAQFDWFDATVVVSPDLRRHSVVLQRSPQAPAWWQERLPRPLRPADDNFTELFTIDVEPANLRHRMRLRDGEQAVLVDDGRLLVTTVPAAADGSQRGHTCCWELPARPAWRWVIGIPAGLGAIVVVAAVLRRPRPGRRMVT